MIVNTLEQVSGTERETQAETWTSRRLLLKSDGMGFSLHDTVLYAGTTTEMEYQNHLEAVYCIEGKGRLKDLSNDKEYPIEAGTVYALSGHERHILIADEQLRMVCVFNPPIVGAETHDENGVYPLME
ncbi:ectoine synthase [Rubinisphaera sp.]|uniref:ectoine synthase n=1 Tax=Rubinisphaera sp. TaxID=2024857 RepID=UPI000C0F76DE|nr:ectoine synthase [Rubinisphaera sp.]MBV09997.1 L-ectoine synthase [Rubinisphaera sp.]HCS54615.1 L-ectoine synthase [Planctomycetaceae bacterium]|tara:strand:+ start:14 stop:397 length:384 start_codon:yes stop_codon:yes gene_type:complete